MPKIEQQIRRGRLKDFLKIWQIRNNFLNRQNSNDQKKIPLTNHLIWLIKKYFISKHNKLFVLLMSNKVIGYLRFDWQKNTYIVSIALEPAYQGRGLGFALLAAGLKLIDFSAPLKAQIKKHNPASYKLFQKCGFTKINEDNDNYYLKYENK